MQNRPEMFLRLPRASDGRHTPVLLVEMTDAQLVQAERFLARQDAAISAGWVVALARWIRQHRCGSGKDGA